jgi:hypothetical protein
MMPRPYGGILTKEELKSLLTVGRDVGALDGLPVDGLIVGV